MFVTADEEYLRYCKRNNFIDETQEVGRISLINKTFAVSR